MMIILPSEMIIEILLNLNLVDFCNTIKASARCGSVFISYSQFFANQWNIDENYGYDLNALNVIDSFCEAAECHWEYF
tara:strand:+ start:296 stop:529 length:234 start_codon:yes stop_codon:yes gene_type:complete